MKAPVHTMNVDVLDSQDEVTITANVFELKSVIVSLTRKHNKQHTQHDRTVISTFRKDHGINKVINDGILLRFLTSSNINLRTVTA